MKYLPQPELDLILSYAEIAECLVSQTQDQGWTFTLRVLNPKDGTLNDYRLLSQRGNKREWKDPRPMFQFLREQYHVKTGHFELR